MSYRNKYLDGEQLYRVFWVDMGMQRSYQKLSAWCKTNGMINPVTGKAPNRMGVWKAMWRWATRNQDIAYNIYSSSETEFILSLDEWKKEMMGKSSSAWQDGK